ncbi:MAG: helix-turn-helix domain-containing protein [Ornithinimicrobium sp.]
MTDGRARGTATRADAQRNRELLLQVALPLMHEEGTSVPLASVAERAGVGIGTLYRHFSSREALLEELTCRSFELLLSHITEALARRGLAVDAMRFFLTAVIADRDSLLLPATGGPAVASERTREAQERVHAAIGEMLARGAQDGSIQRSIGVYDVAWLGASLAQPGRPSPMWEETSGRLLETYLAGLGAAP